MSNKKQSYSYCCAKLSDINYALSEHEQEQLALLMQKVTRGRLERGQGELEAIVIESNSPIYEKTCDALERLVDGRPQKEAELIDFLKEQALPIISLAQDDYPASVGPRTLD